MPEQSNSDDPGQPSLLERQQAESVHQMSERRMGDGGLSFVAMAIVVILAIMFFGLNGRSTPSTSAPAMPLVAR
jgi:hypothetical protein